MCFPAVMDPEPLFRMLPDDILDSAGVTLRVQNNIPVIVSGFDPLYFGSHLQNIFSILFPNEKSRQDRGFRKKRDMRQSR